MTRARSALAIALSTLALAACHQHRGSGGEGRAPGDAASSRPFEAVAPGETLHFTGTEPFWAGQVRGDKLTYSTPATPEGVKIKVTRFAGRNGLGLSGTLDGRSFDMTVTPGSCSDGMSDRRYPFSVTLKLGEELRLGCGWTDGNPASDPAAP